MDRPKHHLLVFVGLALIAAVAVLMLYRQWTSPTAPSASLPTSIASAVEPQPLTARSPTIEATQPAVVAPSSNSTGIRGRVIDAASRKPVKSFEVKLTRTHGDAREELAREFSSAAGSFSWFEIERDTWRVAVTARGYQAFIIDALKITKDTVSSEIVIPLLRGFRIRGRVIESLSRAGIADAIISFKKGEGSDNLERHRVFRSDENGEFTLDGVPSGDVIVSIGAPKRAYREVLIFVDDKTPELEIALSAGATISGVVMTTAGGPAKGEVYVMGPGPGHVGKTSDTGEFSFHHLPAGRYKLSADTSAGSASQAFELHQDEIKEGITLVVGAGRSVRGIVKGLPPERVQDVSLALRTESTNTFFTARPDERGAYAINGVPPGPGMMTVHGEGFRLQKPVNMPADQDLTLDVVIPVGSQLSGRITESGKPASDKLVLLRPVDDKLNIFYQTQADKDGLYEVENLASGEYLVRAEGDISRPLTIAGDATFNIDIPSAQLSARVLEEGGSVPIVGATVYLRGIAPETSRVRGDKQTDDFGQFALTGIESGDVALIVYKPGYEMHRETISYSTPITSKTITLRKDKGVEVRIASGSRRFPRGFTLTQRLPHSEYIVDLWMPINAERVCYIPTALTRTTFEIGRFSGEPIVIEDWDGQPFELP